jgi:endonuclease/exonuclease/phosphatase family metal-dependent hydrolase
MTFNIRGDFDHAKPTVSPEAWIAVSGEHRRDLVTALVQQHDPDILGVQEAFENQIVDLRNVLLGHAHYGVGRDDGEKAGEQSAIFYRTERFAPIEQGSFWLSESPDAAGSVFPARQRYGSRPG